MAQGDLIKAGRGVESARRSGTPSAVQTQQRLLKSARDRLRLLQLTYPLTVLLLGVTGVREVRSYSMSGYSYVYLIFEEDVDVDRSRSKILEQFSSLLADLLTR